MTREDGDNMLMRLSRRKSFIRGVNCFVLFGLDCMYMFWRWMEFG